MHALRPPRLRRGDVIGLISPASTPRSEDRIEGSVRYLESCGYRVQLGQHVAARHGFSAGTDAQRLSDLNAMLRDPRVKAVFALRGGHGCCRLLQGLDYRAAARAPKILVGYSDLTFLQLALWKKCGLISFSAPMPAVEFWQKPDPFTEEAFWGLLTSTARRRTLAFPPESPGSTFLPGRAEGRLLGGCFSLVTSLLGTRFMPSLTEALLFVEDVHEALHRIHRMFTQLELAGILGRLNGLIVGRFTESDLKPGEAHLTLEEILRETLHGLACPVLADVAYGHVPRKITLPQGTLARLDASRRRITLLESPVS